MKLSSPEGGYPAPYGDPYSHHMVGFKERISCLVSYSFIFFLTQYVSQGPADKASLYGSGSAGWSGMEKPRGGRR